MALFPRNTKGETYQRVHENTGVSLHCPHAATMHSIAELCSNIIGAVKVFINKKIRKTPESVAFLWTLKSIYNLH